MIQQDRLHLLDSIRGFCVILMVAYHLGFNLVFYLDFPRHWLYNPVLDTLQPFFAGVFIFISGIASRYSRSNLIRGLKLFPIALAVTLVTWFAGNPIFFGILHFLSIAMIFYDLTRRLWDKIPPLMAIPLYVAALFISQMFTGPGNWPVAWLFPFGFFRPGFSSADYFPLLPWIFVFLAGTSAGGLLREGKAPRLFYGGRPSPLSWIGRRALIIYILHQPILVGLVLLIRHVIR